MSDNISTAHSDYNVFLHRSGKLYKTGPQGIQIATALDVALLRAARCENAGVSDNG